MIEAHLTSHDSGHVFRNFRYLVLAQSVMKF
jgi:hypothetical protein